jgi:hypothetical protein
MLDGARQAIGEDALIIVNSNQNITPNSAHYVNGLYTLVSANWC